MTLADIILCLCGKQGSCIIWAGHVVTDFHRLKSIIISWLCPWRLVERVGKEVTFKVLQGASVRDEWFRHFASSHTLPLKGPSKVVLLKGNFGFYCYMIVLRKGQRHCHTLFNDIILTFTWGYASKRRLGLSVSGCHEAVNVKFDFDVQGLFLFRCSPTFLFLEPSCSGFLFLDTIAWYRTLIKCLKLVF